MIARAPHLTPGHSEVLARQIRATYPGQAHFANSGPFGATCGDYGFLGYHRQTRNKNGDIHRAGCKKFYQLTGNHGPRVPAAACRYFQRKEGGGP